MGHDVKQIIIIIYVINSPCFIFVMFIYFFNVS